MTYPEHLLPKNNYKFINPHQLHAEAHLIRHTNDSDFWDYDSGNIYASYIIAQTNHLRDYSTNLLGIFKEEDCLISFCKPITKDFLDLWSAGDIINIPLFPEDFEKDDTRGLFYLKISDFSGKQFNYLTGQGEIRTAVCHVLHTPVKSNFWHFSLRWHDEKGDLITDQKAKGDRKRVLTAAKSLIQEFAKLESPAQIEINEDLYIEE